ncbi:putative oxidoreductase YdhV [Fundidesulfovibrio magnetotacticus]|uniref:Putative oxidoreductase YdhV n=1 Tax=Fundidesulfovibrio magnetotacticus TaxID=2730080 RepID=A0A6V8M0Y0_9BACT|nr:aldehyde ferredoxin oxidoreductase family protein [Fundidesulfovibrio magnetotacticus]GFK96098.1 putative oxidoreductase YdhV [Fundidesulfovibrio magnetotacticus]
MHGFHNRILTVDLTRRTFAVEPASDEVLEAGLGGKGLATRLLLERNPAGADPLGPENRLIFAAGPFCGGTAWGGSRYGVFTKSPLTGFYAESYSGGRTPEALDAAGFDAVVLEGAADAPLALRIHPEGCEFHDASGLWGMDVYQTEEAALERFALPGREHGRPGAVVIGPAGERLVRFAMIANDKWRCAGRAGVGAVMGSKRLKAVVFQGDRKREPFDAKGLRAYSAAFAKAGVENKGVKAYRAQGTTMMVALMNTVGAFPAKYWSQGNCAHWEKISGETFHKEHDVTPHACLKCFMACGRMATLRSGRHAGLTLEGPEYETIYAFGGLCMIEDMGEVVYLNDLCDRLGMDTITAGNLCALAMEANAQGRGFTDIAYGDAQAAARLIEDMAAGRGAGEVLSQGIVPAARHWGLEDLAIHVKGMEPPGYDPRVLKGMGLAYATSDRGACHLRTTFYKPELAGFIPADAIEGKAEMLVDYEDRLTIFDTLILCRFFRDLYTWEELEKIIPLVTGLDASKEALRRRAAYVSDLTRTFNLREGLTPADDRLPRRLHKEALPDGRALKEEELDYMLKDYYRHRGWSAEGRPGAVL